jgi:hypothetical protein
VTRLLLIFALLLATVAGKAQFLDTLHEVFNHKYSIDARLESRYSFISNQVISVTGLRLGVAFQRKLRMGGGISWLKSDFKNVVYRTHSSGAVDTMTSYLKFVYLCYYIDFVFYKTKRWQLSVPIQAGTGASWFQARPEYAWGGGDRKYFLLLYEPGITAQFKVFRWFGVGGDVAYRFTLKNNRKVGEQLNSPTYSFKLLLWFDQLFYELFPKSGLTKKYGPAFW